MFESKITLLKGFKYNTIRKTKEMGGSYWILALSSFGTISSFICLIYLLLKFKLNWIVKTVFCIMAVHNIVGYSVMNLSNGVIISYDEGNWVTCTLLYESAIFVVFSNRCLSSMISILR